MKKVLFSLITLSCIFFYIDAQAASVNCPAAKVKHIQVENYGVLVAQEGSSWHLVGKFSEESTKYKLSVLLSAQASGKKVVLRYPEGYDCSAYELQTSSKMVRVSDN